MSQSKTGAQALEPILVLALWVLLFTGKEPKISEMKPQLSPKRRKVLQDRGLVELEKRGRARHLVLTDEAWRWAAEHLDADFSINVNGGRALAGLLPRLKAYLDRHGVSLAEILASGELPGSDDIETRIREAYRAASGGEWNVRIRLADLRRELADIPRETQDRALLEMQSAGVLALYPNNDPRDLTGEDHAAALDVVGARRHLVYMKG